MHCIWNLFSLILLCVCDEGSPPRFGDGAEYPLLVPCVLKKNPQLIDPFAATDFGLCFPCEIIVFGH
jgi:hypothetical protein